MKHASVLSVAVFLAILMSISAEAQDLDPRMRQLLRLDLATLGSLQVVTHPERRRAHRGGARCYGVARQDWALST